MKPLLLELLLLAAVGLAAPAAAQQQQQQQQQQAVVCELHVAGGNASAIAHASLACRGAPVAAAAHAALEQALAAAGTPAPPGVAWSRDEACLAARATCLLAVCAGSATFAGATLSGVRLPGLERGAVLCVLGASSVTLLDTRVSNCTAAAGVLASGDGARLRAERLTVEGHSVVHPANIEAGYVAAGALVVTGAARASVAHSAFLDTANGSAVRVLERGVLQLSHARLHGAANEGLAGGGAVVAGPAARAELRHCSFSANRALRGAGLVAAGAARVEVSDSSFVSCSASDGGGALAVLDQAELHGTRLSLCGNRAGGLGGALQLSGSARAAIDASTLEGSTAGGPGGSVAVAGSAQLQLGPGVRVANSSSANKGGGLYLTDRSRTTLRGCTFDAASTGAGGGGAMLLAGRASAELSDCVLRGGSVTLGGGDIALVDRSQVNASRLRLHGGRATFGGSLSAQDDARLRVDSSSVAASTAVLAGGALHAQGNASVALTDVRVSGCAADTGNGGGLLVSGNASLRLARVQVSDCSSPSGGGSGIFQDGGARAVARDLTLRNCTAGVGGALALIGSAALDAAGLRLLDCSAAWAGGVALQDTARASLANATIAGCSAGDGGGMHVQHNASLQLEPGSVTVTGCRARARGGGVFVDTAAPTIPLDHLLRVAHGNAAPAGADVGVKARSLAVLNAAAVEGQPFVSRPGPSAGSSGGLLPVMLRVAGLYNLPVQQQDVLARVGSAPLAVNKTGADGVARLDMWLRRPPGVYNITLSAIISDDSSSPPPAFLAVRVVPCPPGDVTVSAGDACQRCEAGSYSLDPTTALCSACPPGASCPGGATLLPLPGFFQSAPRSAQMHRCLDPAACRGLNASQQQLLLPPPNEAAYKTAQCAPGSSGNICGVCTPGWGRVHASCWRCWPVSLIACLYSVGALLLLAVMRLVCHFTLLPDTAPSCAMLPAAPVHPAAGAAAPAGGAGVQSTALIKSLVLWLQYSLVIFSVHGVTWPAVLTAPLHALAWLFAAPSPQTIGFECLLNRSGPVPVAVQKVLVGLCTPLALLLLLVTVEAATLHWRGRRGRRALRVSLGDRCASLALVVAFFVLPSFARTVFSLFACIELDAPVTPPHEAWALGRWSLLHTDTSCFAGWHRALAYGVGVPLLVVCAALPLGVAGFMLRNRGRLDEAGFRTHWGFLFRPYRSCRCWYEALQCAATLLLVALSVFSFTLGPRYALLAIGVCCALLTLAVVFLRPYREPEAAAAALLVYGCLQLSAFAALSFLPAASGPQPGRAYALAVGAVLLAVNAAVVGLIVWRLTRLVDWAGLGARLAGSRCGRLACLRTLRSRAQRAEQRWVGFAALHAPRAGKERAAAAEAACAAELGECADERPRGAGSTAH